MTLIPPDHLSYPVRLSCDKGNLGTGILLQTDHFIYLVTAKHVLLGVEKKMLTDYLVISTSVSQPAHKSTTIELDLKAAKTDNIIFHPTEDICAINILSLTDDTTKRSFMLQSFVTWHKEENVALTLVHHKDNVFSFENVLVSLDAYLYGYPTSLDLYKEIGFDINTPLIRKGIVSGLNFVNKRIILDCEVHYGNSGGPVTQLISTPRRTYHKIIGIASLFVPFRETFINPRNGLRHEYAINSGYSVVIPLDHILTLIK